VTRACGPQTSTTETKRTSATAALAS
jgi:hypothetical protein